MKGRRLPPIAVFGFLAPNLLGFLAFTLLPVLLSFAMAFTNWSLKPAVALEFVGLRNLSDLIGVRPIGDANGGLCWGYTLAAVTLTLGLVGTLWSNMSQWRGTRIGGAFLLAGGLASVWLTLGIARSTGVGGAPGPLHQGTLIAGLLGALCGFVVLVRDGDLRPGLGTLPSLVVAGSALALYLLQPAMWTVYEPRDVRFWEYFYNTVYLMVGIPFGIGGSLGLALLVNNELTTGTSRIGITPARMLRVFGVFLALGMGATLALKLPGVVAPLCAALCSVAVAWTMARVVADTGLLRAVGCLFCLACALATLLVVWALGNPNVALLGAILWLMVALGVTFDVVAYRTVYYLPTFTAGVALMILWKALYNPETGPINAALKAVFEATHLGINPPEWLSSVAWAKPALIIMGVWTGIGGTNMLLYLAGLSSVPSELLDAADVDGATTWQRFRHVTWPQLAPTTFFISVMSIIGGLQGGFDQARVMTGGGPAGSTTTLSFYIYNKAFQDLDLGYAAAISWVLFAIIFVATALNWRFGKELEVGP